MEQINKFNRDILYKIVLKGYEGCSEYLLVNANDSDEVYAILKDEEIKDEEE